MSPLLLAVPVLVVDLEASDGGLIEGGDTRQWAWGEPSAGPVGEGACWGTVLDGPYLHDSTDWLELAPLDVTSLERPSLELRHWFAIAPGDGGRLEVDEGGGFVPRAPVSGYPAPTGFAGPSGGWTDTLWDLSGLAPGARLRLVFQADTALADDGWYVQRLRVLDGDAVAPVVVPLEVPADTQDLEGPYELALEVTDDVAVREVVTFWSVDGGPEQEVRAVLSGGAVWRATLPGLPPDTTVRVRAEATDGENVRPWPEEGAATFRVFLAAPTGLRAELPPRPVVQQVPLEWDPPESPRLFTGFEVLQDGLPVASSASPRAELAPDLGRPTVFSVRALYEVAGEPFPGDESDPLPLELEIPTLAAVEPPLVWQGSSTRLSVRGASLYLQQGATEARLGEGVAVVGVDVRDAHSADLLVEVSSSAELGPRTLTLDGPLGTWSFDDALSVADDLDAPRILRVEPASLRQGEQLDLELEATVPFGDGASPTSVTVTTDEDLVVLTDPVAEGAVLRVAIAASSRARLGPHTLVVDDGRRLLTAEVEVEEVRVALEPGCGGCDGGSGAGLPWAAAALALRGRRRQGPAGSAENAAATS